MEYSALKKDKERLWNEEVKFGIQVYITWNPNLKTVITNYSHNLCKREKHNNEIEHLKQTL